GRGGGGGGGGGGDGGGRGGPADQGRLARRQERRGLQDRRRHRRGHLDGGDRAPGIRLGHPAQQRPGRGAAEAVAREVGPGGVTQGPSRPAPPRGRDKPGPYVLTPPSAASPFSPP